MIQRNSHKARILVVNFFFLFCTIPSNKPCGDSMFREWRNNPILGRRNPRSLPCAVVMTGISSVLFPQLLTWLRALLAGKSAPLSNLDGGMLKRQLVVAHRLVRISTMAVDGACFEQKRKVTSGLKLGDGGTASPSEPSKGGFYEPNAQKRQLTDLTRLQAKEGDWTQGCVTQLNERLSQQHPATFPWCSSSSCSFWFFGGKIIVYITYFILPKVRTGSAIIMC
ncbi:uncharacterized protein PV09_05984 [Verruconis gallopava]|uniref:Uncharacterized protein n=1 Tax=Verruconis gallopava TaxID=253628 RepID=A0A0D2A859_9PEZI|nr:uncharacterized protein PV09_05984 [Verruconis gallopava]KIW02938.1 hypothetical protein PV09_05984 [Verruconis gallopava]